MLANLHSKDICNVFVLKLDQLAEWPGIIILRSNKRSQKTKDKRLNKTDHAEIDAYSWWYSEPLVLSRDNLVNSMVT